MEFDCLKQALIVFSTGLYERFSVVGGFVLNLGAIFVLFCALIWPPIVFKDALSDDADTVLIIIIANLCLVFSVLTVYAKYTELRLIQAGKVANKWEKTVISLLKR